MQKITIGDTYSTNIEDLPGEIWEDVPGLTDRYQVSNFSRVKCVIKNKNRILKKSLVKGKPIVRLLTKRRGYKYFDCARLTATVFLREPKENEVIRFKDKNKRFTAVFNLEWTIKENGMAKLSAKDLEEIRTEKRNGVSTSVLAVKFKVSERTIQRCVESI